MRLIDTITVPFGSENRRIELLLGDLTRIPEEHRVDALVISAFPRDYTPTPSSLIENLQQSGLSVGELAIAPFSDLRGSFSCWLSREITPPITGLCFSRLLCFEPHERGTPPETVSDIFQALAPFTYAEPTIHSIAMPILATGDQRYSISAMLRPLLTASTNWLANGFPLAVIKLVVRSQNALFEAHAIFQEYKANVASGLPSTKMSREPNSGETSRYDVFVSYAHEDAEAAHHFAERIKQSSLNVFIDRSEIETGASWQQRIFDALENCSITVAFYSPEFVTSKVCKEEFNISWLRAREADRSLIFPLLIRDVTLPAYMKCLNYIDCRISDHEKIASAASALASRLRL